MLLKDIESKLQGFGLPVYYGMVDDRQREMVWDYFVFNRQSIRTTGNKTAASDYFVVHVIRENYVPEGTEDEIIEELTALPGVRRTTEDCTFQYVQKPNTNTVVEMLSIPFVRARKA